MDYPRSGEALSAGLSLMRCSTLAVAVAAVITSLQYLPARTLLHPALAQPDATEFAGLRQKLLAYAALVAITMIGVPVALRLCRVRHYLLGAVGCVAVELALGSFAFSRWPGARTDGRMVLFAASLALPVVAVLVADQRLVRLSRDWRGRGR